MLRMVNLVDDDATVHAIEVVAYRSGDQIMIAINVGAGCLARVFLPVAGCCDPVGAEVVSSWPPMIGRTKP